MRSDYVTLVSTHLHGSLIVAVCCALLVAGCGGSNLRRTPAAERPTPWFCQLNESRDDWECVQDAELARRPRPDRLPTDELPDPEGFTAPPPLINPSVTFSPAEGARVTDDPPTVAAGATGAVWEAMSEQHEAYAQSIAGLTGMSADSRNDEVYDALAPAFGSSAAAEAAYDLESAAAATHIEVLGLLSHRPAAELIASIISAESRHCVVLADLTGRGTDLTALLVNNAQPILPA